MHPSPWEAYCAERCGAQSRGRWACGTGGGGGGGKGGGGEGGYIDKTKDLQVRGTVNCLTGGTSRWIAGGGRRGTGREKNGSILAADMIFRLRSLMDRPLLLSYSYEYHSRHMTVTVDLLTGSVGRGYGSCDEKCDASGAHPCALLVNLKGLQRIKSRDGRAAACSSPAP